MNTVQGEKSNKIGLIHCLDCSVKWNRLEKNNNNKELEDICLTRLDQKRNSSFFSTIDEQKMIDFVTAMTLLLNYSVDAYF